VDPVEDAWVDLVEADLLDGWDLEDLLVAPCEVDRPVCEVVQCAVDLLECVADPCEDRLGDRCVDPEDLEVL